MARVTMLWGLVVAVVALSGTIRYQTRSAYTVGEAGPRLIETARTALPEQGYRITGEIKSRFMQGMPVGLRFDDRNCTGTMSMFEFPITIVAGTFAERHVTDGDDHRYRYYDYSYTGSARPTLTAIWIREMIRNGLALDAGATTKRQIVVIWPKDCAEPSIDWRGLWNT